MMPSWIVDLEKKIEESKKSTNEGLSITVDELIIWDTEKTSSSVEPDRGVAILDISPSSENVILF